MLNPVKMFEELLIKVTAPENRCVGHTTQAVATARAMEARLIVGSMESAKGLMHEGIKVLPVTQFEMLRGTREPLVFDSDAIAQILLCALKTIRELEETNKRLHAFWQEEQQLLIEMDRIDSQALKEQKTTKESKWRIKNPFKR